MTTFTTPFFVMAAEPAYQFTKKLLPQRTLEWLDRYTEENPDNDGKDSDWRDFLREYFIRILIFTTMLSAVALGSYYYLQPYLSGKMSAPYSNLLTALLTLVVMAPFLRAVLVNKTNHPELFSTLWFKKRSNHIPLTLLLFLKILIAAAFLYFVFAKLLGLQSLLAALATAGAAYFISSSDWLMGEYLRMESRFLVNLNERHMLKHREALAEAGEEHLYGWFDEELQLARYKICEDSPMIGQTLTQLAFRELYGCNILQVSTPEEVIDMPGGHHILQKDSTLLMIGTDSQFKLFDTAINTQRLCMTLVEEPITMREFMLREDNDKENVSVFLSCAITIDKHSPILGKSLKDTNIRDDWHCLVIGLERGSYTMTNPNVSLVFEKGDLLWVLGKQKMINQLVREEIL